MKKRLKKKIKNSINFIDGKSITGAYARTIFSRLRSIENRERKKSKRLSGDVPVYAYIYQNQSKPIFKKNRHYYFVSFYRKNNYGIKADGTD